MADQPQPSPEEQRAQLIARGVGLFLLIAIAIGVSQFPMGAGLVWGGLIIAILVILLSSSDKLLGILNTLGGK